MDINLESPTQKQYNETVAVGILLLDQSRNIREKPKRQDLTKLL